MATDSRRNRRGMTRADLTDLVYRLHGGLTRHESAQVVETILGTVKESLLEGRSVKIQNFGVSEVTRRPGRRGVNPISGKPIFIPSQKGLSFRASPKLKQAVEKPRSGESE